MRFRRFMDGLVWVFAGINLLIGAVTLSPLNLLVGTAIVVGMVTTG